MPQDTWTKRRTALSKVVVENDGPLLDVPLVVELLVVLGTLLDAVALHDDGLTFLRITITLSSCCPLP